jgi:serine/threonine protein kinase
MVIDKEVFLPPRGTEQMPSPRCFGDRWEVIQPIDEGGQSYIYKVKDRNGEYSGQFVLKRLKNHKRLDRFEREVKSVQQLHHPSIATILDYSLKEPAFFVTKFYEGGSLIDRAPLPLLSALDLFIKLCDAIAYAHKHGVIHRDLKPDNVVLDKTGVPVIIDFGLCYIEEEDKRITATMEQVGSRFYMAPELEGGRVDSVTEKVDSYALGKILYFLLSGRHIPREALGGENDLVKVCSEDQLGYISDRLLAHTIVEDPQGRKSVAELGEEAKKVKRLIIEHYHPGMEGSLCRFCGEGRYRKMTTSIIRIREPEIGLEHSVTFKILLCDKCGNVQWFRPESK